MGEAGQPVSVLGFCFQRFPQYSRSMLHRNRVEKREKSTSVLLLLGCFLFGFPLTISAQTLAERLGYPSGTKLIIVHADDLGETHAVNAAAIKTLEAGSVNSASLMVPCPWFPEMADYAKSHPSADFGLHLTVTSERVYYRWGSVAPADKVPSLLDENGYFHHDGKITRTSRRRKSKLNCEHRLNVRLRWAFAPLTLIRI